MSRVRRTSTGRVVAARVVSARAVAGRVVAGRVVAGRVVARWARARRAGADVGMTTAEYAVGTVAACGFGGLLYKILTSREVMSMLKDLIEKALTFAF